MEDFVTFEIAKKLKEKGFPQSPDWFNYSSYYKWDGLRKIHSLSNASVWFDPNIGRDNIYFAPRISQVLKWLREENVHLYTDIDNEGWFFEIKCLKTRVMINTDFFKRHSTCELATIAGIEYVIDNLI